jgi:hypothetical protein
MSQLRINYKSTTNQLPQNLSIVITNTSFIDFLKNSTNKEIPYVLNMGLDVSVQME